MSFDPFEWIRTLFAKNVGHITDNDYIDENKKTLWGFGAKLLSLQYFT